MRFYDYFLIAHLLFAGYFMFMYARISGIGLLGASLTASASILNGWTLVEFGFVHYSPASLFPVLLLSMEVLARRPGLRSSLLAAMAVAATIFSGHPMEAFVLIVGGAVYCVIRIIVKSSHKLSTSSLWLLLSLFLAALYCSFIIMPFVEFLEHGISYKLISVYYPPPKISAPTNLLGIVFPAHTPVYGDMYYLGFVGIGVCLLGIYGIWSGGLRRNLPYIVLIVFSFGMSFEVFPLSLLRALPLLDMVDPRYSFPLFFFPVAFLAGQGLDLLMGTNTRAQWVKIGAGSLSVAELLFRLHGLIIFHPSFVFPETAPLSFVKKDDDIFRVMMLGAREIINTPNGGMVHHVQDLRMTENIVVRRYWRFFHLADKGLRILHIQGLLFPTAMYVTLPVSPYWDLMNVRYVLSPKSIREPSLERVYSDPFLFIYKNRNAFPRAFVVHRVIFSENEAESLTLLKKHRNILRRLCIIEENDQEERKRISEALKSSMPEGEEDVKITGYLPHRVTVEVTMHNPGFLILSDTYYPGWKVTVDGREEKIFPTDYLIRGVFLEKGDHSVEFSYEPMSFTIGVIISALGIAMSLIVLFIFPSRMKDTRSSGSLTLEALGRYPE